MAALRNIGGDTEEEVLSVAVVSALHTLIDIANNATIPYDRLYAAQLILGYASGLQPIDDDYDFEEVESDQSSADE